MKWINYNLCAKINHGTEEVPEWEEILSPVSVAWNEANEEMAKNEAYNGDYTIDDDGQPEQDNTSTDDVINALLGVTE